MSTHTIEADIPGFPGNATANRRKKRNGQERLRVGRACDYCKRKKIRCTGEQPCHHCTNEGVSCEYNAPYARGKRKKAHSQLTTPSATPPTVRSISPTILRAPQQDIVEESSSTTDVLDSTRPVCQAAATQHNGSSRASPEPGESDRQGHFVGASSGLSFLLRLQRRLRKDIPEPPSTSVFTLGDAVLPDFDELGFIPPPRHEAESLLRTYFELASPTYRFLHRPTIERWMQQLYDHGHVSGDQTHAKYAVILTMFAQAVRYTGAASNTPNANTGVEYFQAAERQLGRETESATLTSVQALLGCCFYVLTRSRLNHCWTLFGTTARLILALGLHRKKAKFDGERPSPDLVHTECSKRLFWCAYNLDKYLSAIFGRPCAFHDDDIDQDMPAVVEDADLTPDSMGVASTNNMNIMLGPLNHQKLGQILSSTLRRLYGIRPLDRETRYRTMSELGDEVKAWQGNLPAFLNPEMVDSRLLIPLFQRQSNLLSLASGHAEILIFRPCLFNDYQQAASIKDSEETMENVQRCLRAAMAIVAIIDRMVETGQFFAASWFSHYQAFSAVVVLYTYTIRSRNEDPSNWLQYFRAAERCQGLIATVASFDSLAQRFFVIMEEFRLEVVKQLQHDSPSPHVLRQEPAVFNQPDQAMSMPTVYNTNANTWLGNSNPQDPLDFLELPDWKQLDSLALDLGGVLQDLGPLS